MSESTPKRIGIAVVEYRGQYLIGTRGPDGPLAGYAEFPGGKCLPNESPEACAVRECKEETQLEVTVERLLLRRDYIYPHAIVDLHFFLCHPVFEESVRTEHTGFRWIPSAELDRLTFPDANKPLVEELINNGDASDQVFVT